MKKQIDVVAAIIKDGDNILATRRAYGEFENMWEFPGGKIEACETKEVALIREIKEELDVDIQIDSFLVTVTYNYETFDLTMHCFICHIVSGQIALQAHNAIQWLKDETLDSVTWLPADVAVVEAIRSSKQLSAQ